MESQKVFFQYSTMIYIAFLNVQPITELDAATVVTRSVTNYIVVLKIIDLYS